MLKDDDPLKGAFEVFIAVFRTADGGVVHQLTKLKLSKDVYYATSSASVFFSKHGKVLFVWQAMVQGNKMIKDPSN